MKKYFILVFIFFVFSQSASATEISTATATNEPVCNISMQDGSFTKKSDCSGSQKERFYIDDIEVTKAEFDKKKAFRDKNGELCTETVKSKSTELPIGLSFSCEEGKYGQYYIFGKKVSYADFIARYFGSSVEQALADSIATVGAELKRQQKELATYKKFLATIKSTESLDYLTQFPKIGSECLFAGFDSLIINGDGTKSMCTNGFITEVEYYLANKKVTFEVYTKKKYKTLKAANKKALKDWKKQQGK